ncbi:hypothetical protein PHYSODRAFT_313107 [Phytophthora sojae]|uniref:Uncharacterized protein n=1 Tax=Phytophthora sojae (strain P6497) TaxID=1094619 RepID=G4Z886_PHYSP|nr:hypothetical protein PHYSODRAFT_313107 [Phytophthora sojae]EGZ20438.1 hypothetical protein PHYSODRAFT_313107 [Phytophthora sojae]|eukprot:XP_009523155.1 hypothetical protein PHYSODRAFT_313107 [Phytophthora sojae]
MGVISIEGADEVVSLLTQVIASEHDQDAAVSRTRSKPESSTPVKKRKTAYDIRREQKGELTGQVDKLQKQLDELKYWVLLEQGKAAQFTIPGGNRVLQEFIQEQHLELANLQAMLAANLQQNVASLQPAHTIIRLGSDPIERHKTLVALKAQKLREAMRFISARSQGLDPRSTYFQEERNNMPEEDFCLVIFENRAVHGVSARMVFDAFIDVAHSSEIVVSEMFGSVTIREDDEADARDISQMRAVTSTTQGTLVESNSPEERARRDTTTVFMIRSFLHPLSSDRGGNEGKEFVVAASRWSCSKIRRSAMNLSPDAMQELQESTVSFGNTMKKCILQRLGKR